MALSKEKKQEAAKLMKEYKVKTLFADENGNFFLTRNLAELAAGSKKDVSEIREADVTITEPDSKKEETTKK